MRFECFYTLLWVRIKEWNEILIEKAITILEKTIAKMFEKKSFFCFLFNNCYENNHHRAGQFETNTRFLEIEGRSDVIKLNFNFKFTIFSTNLKRTDYKRGYRTYRKRS